jgi:hypothetical protein
MTPRGRSALVALTVFALALLGEGCSSTNRAGSTASVYRRGWFRTPVAAPHYIVDKAMRKTATRARLLERERTCNGYKSFYVFQDLRDVKVKVKLKSTTPDSTKVRIRVGFWGNRASSQELFQGLQEDIDAINR